MVRVEREQVFSTPVERGFAAITDIGNWPADARHERHFRPVEGGFAYRIVVEYEPRRGLRGLLDRTIVRRGVDRAVRRTLVNLEAMLGAS